MKKTVSALRFGSTTSNTSFSQIVYALFRFYCGMSIAFITPSFGQSGLGNERVSFTLSNPTLKMREVDIRYFDPQSATSRGYGYALGALSSHAVNMPVGTRVYKLDKNGKELLFVVSTSDHGRTFDLTKKYEIGSEQLQQVAGDEQNQETAQHKKAIENPDLATIAQAKGYAMVRFLVSGKTAFGRQIKIRAQLPFDTQKSNTGFSRWLSTSTKVELFYPVGTKIYLCDGDYWLGDVKETLLFTVDIQKANTLIQI